MAGFLDWFFTFLTTMIDGVWMIFSGFFKGIIQIFNVSEYLKQFNAYKAGFGIIDWIFAILSLLLVIAIWGILIYLAILGIRKYIRFRRSAVGNEDLLEEVATLHRDVLKLTKEREKLLALKIGHLLLISREFCLHLLDFLAYQSIVIAAGTQKEESGENCHYI